mgnify:CR=1
MFLAICCLAEVGLSKYEKVFYFFSVSKEFNKMCFGFILLLCNAFI